MSLVFFPSQWEVSTFLAAYITFPIFLVLYFGHKIYWATYQVRKGEAKSWFAAFSVFAIRTPDIDVITGKQEMDELEAMDVPPVPRNFLQKVCFMHETSGGANVLTNSAVLVLACVVFDDRREWRCVSV